MLVKVVLSVLVVVAAVGYVKFSPSGHTTGRMDMSPDFRGGAQASGWTRNAQGLWLYRHTYEVGSPVAHLAVLHGYAQHSGLFESLVKGANAAGITVHVMDLQGHGRSEGDRIYVEAFAHYVDDVAEWVVASGEMAKTDGVPLFLFGHSMGGLISTNVAMDDRAAGVLAGLVLSAPALMVDPRINTTATRTLGMTMSSILPHLPVARVVIDGAYTDKAREAQAINDPLVCSTGCWTLARTGAEVLTAIDATFEQLPHKLTTPFLLLHGTKDSHVPIEGSHKLMAAAQGVTDKTFDVFDGAAHELLDEPNGTGDAILAGILTWIKAHI